MDVDDRDPRMDKPVCAQAGGEGTRGRRRVQGTGELDQGLAEDAKQDDQQTGLAARGRTADDAVRDAIPGGELREAPADSDRGGRMPDPRTRTGVYREV